MKKTERFRFLGQYPEIDALVSDVLALEKNEWNYFTYRQKTIVGHRDTETVPLIFDWKKLHRHTEHRNLPQFAHHLESLSAFLSDLKEPSIIRRANLVRLKAHSEISPHVDKGEFLSSLHRVHIPVTTNPDCWFTVGGERHHLGVGVICEINNTDEIHSVQNHGSTDRIHLIIDVADTADPIQ